MDNFKYYPRYKGDSTSAAEVLREVGEQDTSLLHRMQIAHDNDISASNNVLMNIRLLEKLKDGTLKKA